MFIVELLSAFVCIDCLLGFAGYCILSFALCVFCWCCCDLFADVVGVGFVVCLFAFRVGYYFVCWFDWLVVFCLLICLV